MLTIHPFDAAAEIREQLASEKRRLGFFLGAGASMAVGVPGIGELTDLVIRRLTAQDELMIFPSRQKYAESRKLPYITFQDHFRRFLGHGECLLIILGYSFSDEHLNEIIFQNLRSNPRLAVMIFSYGDTAPDAGGVRRMPETLIRLGREFRNLAIYGPDSAVVGGIMYKWACEQPVGGPDQHWPFWDTALLAFTLGDFTQFAAFLEQFIGFKPSQINGHRENPVSLASMMTEEPMA